MKILFESYIYPTSLLSNILSERYFYQVNSLKSRVDYVGYYFNSQINEAVFILPKVFLYNNLKAFGLYNPEEIVDCNEATMDQLASYGKDKVIFELSVWLYQSMVQFNKRKKENLIHQYDSIGIVSNIGDNIRTELDILLSLISFHKENKELFTQVTKLNHSNRNKIHWGKTVAKKHSLISVDNPVYMDVIAHNKGIQFDEEIIVIFYSVLNYMSKKYSFNIKVSEHYNLIEGHRFERLLENGTRFLKKIRYKYYSDRFISLWNLLFLYFERSEKMKSGRYTEEVLMIKDFNLVFEDMIDDLIGEDNIDKGLKKQKDGKRVDHIYNYESLLKNDNIYYVGDSKYYRPDNDIVGESIAKQYTYAKNVIQYNIDLFNKDLKLNNNLRYRDDLTEGYNITPNFFITAFVEEDFNFSIDGLHETGTSPMNFHFKDRLFDRDTLLLKTYNINFLFVLSTYIARDTTIKQRFKQQIRIIFRTHLLNYLNYNYTFLYLTPVLGINEFVEKYFKLLNGKIYRPSKMEEKIILAIPKGIEQSIIKEIHKDTYHEYFELS